MRGWVLLLIVCGALWAGEFQEAEGKHTYAEARHLCGETFGEGWRLPEIGELFTLRGKTESYGSDKSNGSFFRCVAETDE